MTEDYRSTVFLPRTDFPMRGDLPKREPALLKAWQDAGLWEKLRANPAPQGQFTLHDGPPYANGNLHIGHALNKILKDVINRARQMAGYDADYIPGWDCHGLPIEWKIEEEYRKAGKDKDQVPVLQFRAECRAYAQKWLKIQADEFARLGVAANWENRYATMDFPSEAAIAGEIGKFLLNGSLYRGLRPVMWSPVEKTALAEAEVEYHDHKSTTIHVRFPVLTGAFQGADIVIWTTTPWTIPGNRAVAYSPDITYALIEIASIDESPASKDIANRPAIGVRLLVAESLVPRFAATAGITATIVQTFPGTALEGTICAHPLRGQGYDFDVPALAGDFVTDDAGTGIVHMAPSHGEDDFALCRANGVAVPETVGEDGTFMAHVPHFAGIHVYKAADPMCAALDAVGKLVAREQIVHSYPHSWRSKAPLITRATPQWFIRMDGPEQIRTNALKALETTRFVPDAGRNRIGSMIAARPDWCISRQRAWGVPIPVFVHRASGEPLRDEAVLNRVVEAFRVEGADAWYASPASRFLGPDHDPADYDQVNDIVDVWFESGCTHAFVLEARNMPWPADLYLEGSDQHRGWFHSSLLEAIGSRGKAPFKAVLTHGFVLDEQGRKMSKSLGNVTAPQTVCDEYGADILRLWVMSSDTSEDLRIGKEILKQQAELYRRLRNTLRWLLGGLDGFAATDAKSYAELPELERFILHRLTELDSRIRQAVETYDWTGVMQDLHHFCATDLSAFYFDVRKDSLYCDHPNSPRRQAVRTVLDHLHRCLTLWLAPSLPFTAAEAWSARFGETAAVALEHFPNLPAEWKQEALAEKWATIRRSRAMVTGTVEQARREGVIRSSLEAQIAITPDSELGAILTEEEWAEICIVSKAEIAAAPTTQTPPAVSACYNGQAPGEKCARCWRVMEEVGTQPDHPSLCTRCAETVRTMVCEPVTP